MAGKLDKIKRDQYGLGGLFDVLSEISSELPELSEGWPFFDSDGKRRALVDLKETDKDLIAYIELPGVDKEDVHLDITEDTLEAIVKRKSETKDERSFYLRQERSYSEFYRLVRLPYRIKAEEAKATYKDGVLEVVMPKAEQRTAKKVEIE